MDDKTINQWRFVNLSSPNLEVPVIQAERDAKRLEDLRKKLLAQRAKADAIDIAEATA